MVKLIVNCLLIAIAIELSTCRVDVSRAIVPQARIEAVARAVGQSSARRVTTRIAGGVTGVDLNALADAIDAPTQAIAAANPTNAEVALIRTPLALYRAADAAINSQINQLKNWPQSLDAASRTRFASQIAALNTIITRDLGTLDTARADINTDLANLDIELAKPTTAGDPNIQTAAADQAITAGLAAKGTAVNNALAAINTSLTAWQRTL